MQDEHPRKHLPFAYSWALGALAITLFLAFKVFQETHGATGSTLMAFLWGFMGCVSLFVSAVFFYTVTVIYGEIREHEAAVAAQDDDTSGEVA